MNENDSAPIKPKRACGPYGCTSNIGNSCGPYGCTSRTTGSCGPYGCTSRTGDSCGPYGCTKRMENEIVNDSSPIKPKRACGPYGCTSSNGSCGPLGCCSGSSCSQLLAKVVLVPVTNSHINDFEIVQLNTTPPAYTCGLYGCPSQGGSCNEFGCTKRMEHKVLNVSESINQRRACGPYGCTDKRLDDEIVNATKPIKHERACGPYGCTDKK